MSTRPGATSSATRQLAERALGGSLADYIAEKRAARPQWPWRLIARQLTDDTNGEIVVSHETVRLWFADDVARVEGRAS
jgi:hypothetical protein